MADEERAAKRRRYTGPIITLVVGEDQERFSVHEEDLRKSCPFFRAALDKKWAEGQKGEIGLPDDDPETVLFYLDWLSSKQVTGCVTEDGEADYDQLAKLYVLGEKIQDSAFKQAVLVVLIKGIDEAKEDIPAASTVRIIYEGTPSESPARSLLVQAYVQQGAPALEVRHDYVVEFLVDLANGLLAARKNVARGTLWLMRKEWLEEDS